VAVAGPLRAAATRPAGSCPISRKVGLQGSVVWTPGDSLQSSPGSREQPARSQKNSCALSRVRMSGQAYPTRRARLGRGSAPIDRAAASSRPVAELESSYQTEGSIVLTPPRARFTILARAWAAPISAECAGDQAAHVYALSNPSGGPGDRHGNPLSKPGHDGIQSGGTTCGATQTGHAHIHLSAPRGDATCGQAQAVEHPLAIDPRPPDHKRRALRGLGGWFPALFLGRNALWPSLAKPS